MEASLLSLQSLFFIPLLIQTSVTAQPINSNVTDFSCSSNSSNSCSTYVAYRTQSPNFLDPGSISDLFGVSRLSIMRANNLRSENVIFPPYQLLLVPISCGCSGNQYFYNITYRINPGDSFYLVSINEFENLTNWVVVQAMNPSLMPTKLMPGDDVIFPLFCKCPTKAQLDRGLRFLITYVWQAGDNISQLSKMMNSSVEDIEAANNYRNFSASEHRPILIPVSKPPLLPQFDYSAPLQHQKPKSYRRTIIVLSTLVAVLSFMLSCLLIVGYCKFFRKKVLFRKLSTFDTGNLHWFKKPSNVEMNVEMLSPRTMVNKVLPGVSGCLDKMVVFEMEEIMESTMNFDERFRISGSVYRAIINEQVLAVKKVGRDVSEELKILQKVNHANLVKLAGFSADLEGGFFMLYEFVENGSLDKWLHRTSDSSTSILSWRQRLNIALDVANGLQYLHEHNRPSIIHRDLRTSTILLDGRFKAKISNFSIAKPGAIDETTATDVLAFGLVLLELLSGKGGNESEGMSLLWKEVRIILEEEEKREDRLKQWMDPNLSNFYPIDGALSLAVLAMACTSSTASARPRMAEIVFSLSILGQSSSDAFERSVAEGIMNPLAAR